MVTSEINKLTEKEVRAYQKLFRVLPGTVFRDSIFHTVREKGAKEFRVLLNEINDQLRDCYEDTVKIIGVGAADAVLNATNEMAGMDAVSGVQVNFK